MAIQKITIEEFLSLAKSTPVFDVRSPGEYLHAHIPGAHSLPLFSDEERKQVGTAYKQQSRETAIKLGLDFFGPKMKQLVQEVENIMSAQNPQHLTHQPPAVILHCWRGGMRSAALAWLLDLYGFKVYSIAGGYKAYRKWVVQQFEKKYDFNIIGGYTGSGKTLLLHEFAEKDKAIIDLEALANHKGSALGGLGKGTQPRQEMFENCLAQELAEKSSTVIFLEDESQRIGDLQIPMPLWHTIRTQPVYFLDIPFEARLAYLTEEYSHQSKEKLVNAVMRIQKRLGGLETKNAVGFLLEDNCKESFRILLKYYDKYYLKALLNRDESAPVIKIISETVDPKINAALLLNKTKNK